jgi:monofunctional biosynthetic peptidoglycan transglycosylase
MKSLMRWLVLLAASVLALQMFFVLRIAVMIVLDPQSSAFQR